MYFNYNLFQKRDFFVTSSKVSQCKQYYLLRSIKLTHLIRAKYKTQQQFSQKKTKRVFAILGFLEKRLWEVHFLIETHPSRPTRGYVKEEAPAWEASPYTRHHWLRRYPAYIPRCGGERCLLTKARSRLRERGAFLSSEQEVPSQVCWPYLFYVSRLSYQQHFQHPLVWLTPISQESKTVFISTAYRITEFKIQNSIL